MYRIIKFIKRKLGIPYLETNIQTNSNRLSAIEDMIQVGVDINYYNPSWVVICVRGKNGHDIVRFFNLPHNDLLRLLEQLKDMEKFYHTKPVYDAPMEIRRELSKW